MQYKGQYEGLILLYQPDYLSANSFVSTIDVRQSFPTDISTVIEHPLHQPIQQLDPSHRTDMEGIVKLNTLQSLEFRGRLAIFSSAKDPELGEHAHRTMRNKRGRASSAGELHGQREPKRIQCTASSDSSVRESDKYDLVVAALCVVIGPGRRKDRMLDTVKELQLTSRAVCESCRRNACFHLNVERGTPRRLFPVVRDGRPLRSRGSQHIPAVHVVSLTWNRSARDLAGGLVLPPSLKTIVFGATFRGSVSDVYWPQRTEKLHFQSKFDRPLDKMKWPQSLRHLVLGRDFKQDVEDIPWPSDRDKMAFRSSFDQPIDGVPWPSMLRTLVITGRFNQPLGNVVFPATLRHLHLVTLFDHPIDEVRWPVGLRSLTFGVFNQPVEGVRWPEQLEHLTFIFEFNQPIKGVDWPPGLRVLRLGSAFNHPFDGVVWPGALRKLSIGVEFSYAINKYVLPERVEVERVTAKYDSLILSSLMD